MHCTQAHTPQLTAFKRHRPVNAVSREKKEEMEMEEMKKYINSTTQYQRNLLIILIFRNQFKAHPIDEKVFKAPALPLKKETKPTKFEPFKLSESHKKEVKLLNFLFNAFDAKSMECSCISFICTVIFLFLQNVPPSEAENEHDHQFHARPIPKNVFEVPNVERKPMPVTVPQTPKFSEAGKASLYNWRRQRSKVIFIFLVLRTYFNFLLPSRTAAWGRPRATRRRDRLTRQEVNE